MVKFNIEMTTQQTADFLKVSRSFLVRLLEKGEIPLARVGNTDSILFAGIQAYKNEIDAKRFAVLEELAAEARALNMGY